MHLIELLQKHGQPAATSVPNWMLGCFKRRSISFANGQTDLRTHVYWLQSRNITIDLRLPIDSEQLSAAPLSERSKTELRALANYEGWYAESTWENQLLSWHGGTSFQIHNRWPEPAILKRVGDCMMEFSPDDTYIEDWRLQSKSPGALLGLRLIEEQNLDTGEIRHRKGALIINGSWAGLVLGRSDAIENENPHQLRDLMAQASMQPDMLKSLFNFETSVATGNLNTGFEIRHSTQAERKNKTLFCLDGFEFENSSGEIIHTCEVEGTSIKRRFQIDTLESNFNYCTCTPFSSAAAKWFQHENETLARYLEAL